jgi:hypothetical protein
MMWDVALDEQTGDWLFSSNTDLQAVVGDQVVKQRIMTRLKMPRGWILDQTNGSLGSSLRALVHLPRGRLLNELPLAVKEALEPMDDIEIKNVYIEEGIRQATVHLEYVTIDPTATTEVDNQIVESLALDVGV